MTEEFWNSRYREHGYAYGEEPNAFLKERLEILNPGKILFPAEGEGRNAVYAAKRGWDAYAFDQSVEGQRKAHLLAEKNGVQVHYHVGTFPLLPYHEEQFDAIALIFAHFPKETKASYHKQLSTYLKKGGLVFFEAFSKDHLHFNSINESAGGPKDRDLLFSVEELKTDFNHFEILELKELELDLEEGIYHRGRSAVVRMVARKK